MNLFCLFRGINEVFFGVVVRHDVYIVRSFWSMTVFHSGTRYRTRGSAAAYWPSSRRGAAFPWERVYRRGARSFPREAAVPGEESPMHCRRRRRVL